VKTQTSGAREMQVVPESYNTIAVLLIVKSGKGPLGDRVKKIYTKEKISFCNLRNKYFATVN